MELYLYDMELQYSKLTNFSTPFLTPNLVYSKQLHKWVSPSSRSQPSHECPLRNFERFGFDPLADEEIWVLILVNVLKAKPSDSVILHACRNVSFRVSSSTRGASHSLYSSIATSLSPGIFKGPISFGLAGSTAAFGAVISNPEDGTGERWF
jgi:hypothetical protein